MPKTDPVEALIDLLNDDALHKASNFGGYPDHITVIGDHLVIAGDDGEDGTFLEWWPLEAARQWYVDVVANYKEEDGDWLEALNETRPEPAGRMSN